MRVITDTIISRFTDTMALYVANTRNPLHVHVINGVKYQWDVKRCAFQVGDGVMVAARVFTELSCNRLENVSYRDVYLDVASEINGI